MRVDFRILGPLEVVDPEGHRVDLGAPLQRAVLALLLVHMNEVVSVDRLIDGLWGEVPPKAVTASLQVYISNLRRALEPERPPRTPATVLVTEPPGYVLRVSPGQVDAERFAQLAAEGRRALGRGDAGTALHRLDAALALWRGDALAEFAYDAFAAAHISRLHELRTGVEEDRVEARLVGGDLAGAATALGPLVQQHPLRERPRALQMRVLYSAGRQVEALRAYEETRALLADELGLEPGPALRRLHRQVLEHDPALDPRAPAAPLPAPDRGVDSLPAVEFRPHQSGFVGRDTALTRLLAAIDDACRGNVRVLLIDGDAGIGKTRLAEEAASRSREGGARVVWGHCHDDDGSPPLWPWVQILRGLLGDDEVPDQLRPRLAALLPELGPATSDDLLPEVARFQLFDAVRETISLQAGDQPSIIVIDDLHWADATSLRLLGFLAVELRNTPVAVIATFRGGDAPEKSGLRDTLADMARRPGVERLTLHGLSERDVAELLRTTTSVADDEVAAVAATLHRRTDGNPFFLTELVRLMQSERRLTAGTAPLDIPAAVTDVIRRRLQRLPDEVQTVLDVAAVVGREFEVDVLADACGLGPDRVVEILETALVTRVVVEGDAPDRYRFTHALVNETLYGDLPPSRRIQLHRRVAAAIETVWQADLSRHYSELAHHCSNASAAPSESAVGYAQLAAQQATARLAYDDAVRHWRAAVAMLERLRGATSARRARALLELAAAERRAGNLAAAAKVHDQALALARVAGDPELVADLAVASGEIDLWQVREYGTVDDNILSAIAEVLAVLDDGDSPLRTRLLTGLAVAQYFREGARDGSRALVREAVAMARRLGDAGLLAAGLMELLVMLDTEPDQTEQLAAATELRSIDCEALTRDAVAAAASRLTRVALAAGDASRLDDEIAACVAQAHTARRLDELLWATWAGTAVAFLRGRFDEAERLAGEAFELHRRLGLWGAEESLALHMVFLWREQGRMAEMAPLVEPVLAQWVHPNVGKIRALFALETGAVQEIAGLLGPNPLPRFWDFTWVTDACITAELAAEAQLPCRAELYDMLLPFAGRIATMDGTFVCLGAVAYYLGLLAASLGRGDEARGHLDHAIELNERIGAVPWSRRARARRDQLLVM